MHNLIAALLLQLEGDVTDGDITDILIETRQKLVKVDNIVHHDLRAFPDESGELSIDQVAWLRKIDDIEVGLSS